METREDTFDKKRGDVGEQQLLEFLRDTQLPDAPPIVRSKLDSLIAPQPYIDNIQVANHGFFNCNINTRGGLLTNTAELYDYIEKYTKDLIETIIKGNINGFNHATGAKDNNPIQNYVIIGGKALNLIVGRKYLNQSFDFDMHIYNGTEDDIDIFSQHISRKINEFLNDEGTKVFRFFLYQVLLHHELITPAQHKHYMSAQLFYSGERVKTNFIIRGLFIHLKLRPDLISNSGGNNLSNPPNWFNTNDGTGPSIDLFYPIADIDLEDTLNFGIPITNVGGVMKSYGGLNYAKFVFLVYNLFRYVQQGGFKQPKNFHKLQSLVNPLNNTCSFTLNDDSQALNLWADLKSMNIKDKVGKTKGTQQTLIVDGRDIFDPDMPMYDVLNSIIRVISQHRQTMIPSIVDLCRNRLVLDYTFPNKNNITTDVIFQDPNKFRYLMISVENVVFDSDFSRRLLMYTSNAYQIITRYLQYTYFGYDTNGLSYGIFDVEHDGFLTPPLRKQAVNEQITITQPTVKTTCDEITNIFSNIRANGLYTDSIKNISDVFSVYRITTYFSYKTSGGEFFNPSVLQKNCIVYVPHFQSTSYSTNFSYNDFLYETSMILKITIPKISKKWAIMNKYSCFPDECEVLLDKDIYYVTTGWNYVPVRTKKGFMDVPMLELLCFDNINDATFYTLTHNLADAQIGGDGNKLYCINMTPKPEMIETIKSIVGSKKEVVDFGNIFDVPKDDLMKMDDPVNIAKLYSDYLKLVYQSESKLMSQIKIQPQIYAKIGAPPDDTKKELIEKYKQQYNPIQYSQRQIQDISKQAATIAAGGASDSKYLHKYLKYKQKYLQEKMKKQ